jgi:hypothetical protein
MSLTELKKEIFEVSVILLQSTTELGDTLALL